MSRQTLLIGDAPTATTRAKVRTAFFAEPNDGSAYRRVKAIMENEADRMDQRPKFKLPLKGDKEWMNAQNPLGERDYGSRCPGCGTVFFSNSMGGFHSGRGMCGSCSARLGRGKAMGPGPGEMGWQSQLHGNKLIMAQPGKAIEYLKPQTNYLNYYAQFDSPEERKRVGFQDRGKRRYQNSNASDYHGGGWTSGIAKIAQDISLSGYPGTVGAGTSQTAGSSSQGRGGPKAAGGPGGTDMESWANCKWCIRI
jgi:hypothetical protein